MRHFSSYGPLDPDVDFHIRRSALVEKVANQLVGDPDKGGHFFTIYAPRQAGKTTTLREAAALIQQRYGDRFQVGIAILHLVDDLRVWFPSLLRDSLQITIDRPETWDDLGLVFSVNGPLKKPTILILDEFDGLPKESLNQAITLFRKIYHNRQSYLLHGLALIGVHALLGSLENTLSPFNVQRSIRIPNLTREEVIELYAQYQRESQQRIEPEVVEQIYDLMRGQPGLTNWFGEVLTEKNNPADPTPYDAKELPEDGFPTITLEHFRIARRRALSIEFNINIRNLIQKGRQHRDFLVQLFYSHDIRFELRDERLHWLYLNGLIAWESSGPDGEDVCVFASPFVQKNIFAAYADDMLREWVPASLVPSHQRETLQNMLERFDLSGVLGMYRDYIRGLELKGAAPWRLQPTRSDARPYEAIGHFNLYAWLSHVSKNRMVVTPEFRTRNGTADLVLRGPRGPIRDVIEVKSFSTVEEFEQGLEQVARYARTMQLSRAFLLVMVDESAERLLKSRPATQQVEDVTVHIEPIRWGGEGQGEVQPSQTPDSQTPHKQIPPSEAAPGASSSGAGSSSAGGRRSRAKSSRQRKPPKPMLTIHERLGLEEAVLPLLTDAQAFARLVLRLNLDEQRSEEQRDLIRDWNVLVNRCEAEGRLDDLLVVLVYANPTLRTAPVITRIQERLKSSPAP